MLCDSVNLVHEHNDIIEHTTGVRKKETHLWMCVKMRHWVVLGQKGRQVCVNVHVNVNVGAVCGCICNVCEREAPPVHCSHWTGALCWSQQDSLFSHTISNVS